MTLVKLLSMIDAFVESEERELVFAPSDLDGMSLEQGEYFAKMMGRRCSSGEFHMRYAPETNDYVVSKLR